MEEGQQGIKTKVIMEIMGAPKEHVEQTLERVIKKIDENEQFDAQEDSRAETVELKEKPGLWSTFSELTITFKTNADLLGFCFDFMPSSVEIVEPANFAFGKDVLEGMTNDLLARLHQYDMMLKNLHAQNIMMKKEIEKKAVADAQPKGADLVVEKKEE